jgi:hypothetical protein
MNLMDHDRQHVKECLEAEGFMVELVPEADEERADLLAHDAADVYVVEVKGKEVTKEYRDLVAQAATGAVACLDREVKRRNRLDGIVHKAESQLVATPAAPGAFRLLWVRLPENPDGYFIRSEFEQTLYGSRDLLVFTQDRKLVGVLPCYYYGHASFFRCKRIEAAILDGPDGGNLYLNEFGERADAFRKSSLYRSLAGANAVTDPVLQERAGKAIAVRGDPDRRDQHALREYFQRTYGYLTAAAHTLHGTVMTSTPLGPTEADLMG